MAVAYNWDLFKGQGGSKKIDLIRYLYYAGTYILYCLINTIV